MRTLALLALSLLIAACGGAAKPLEPGTTPVVMASTPHLASLAMAVAGQAARVEMLPPANKTSHEYSPTIDDRRRLDAAHLFIVNGLGLETYDVANVARMAKARLIDCGTGFPEGLLLEPAEEPESEGHGHAHDHGSHNPHVWLSVDGALHQAGVITEALATLDPANADGYRARLGELASRLKALRDEYRPRIDAMPRKAFVSNHDAFPYFAREFGLRQVGVIQRTPGHNPTLAERREIEERLRKGEAAAIFLEPGYDDAASQAIAKSTGLKLATLDPFDAGTPGPTALEDVLRKNLETVLATLGD